MPKYTVYKLHFNSPLHLSHGKHDQYDKAASRLHSDSILAAVYAVASKWFSQSDMAKPEIFFHDWVISSAFPFIGEHLFFPKPFVKLNIQVEDQPEEKLPKTLKKLEWIELGLFNKLLQGHDIKVQGNQLIAGGKYLMQKPMTELTRGAYAYYTEQKLNKLLFALGKDEDPVPYYLDRQYFTPGCGLFFMAAIKSADQENNFLTYLRMLGDEGIGTDRHNGNGTFDVSTHQIEIPLEKSKEINDWINLSLLCPQKAEMEDISLTQSAYKLLKRGGYMAGSDNWRLRTFRKKSIFMFEEGSVFSSSKAPVGKVVNLKPEAIDETITGEMHAIWRSGKALCLPIVQNSAL